MLAGGKGEMGGSAAGRAELHGHAGFGLVAALVAGGRAGNGHVGWVIISSERAGLAAQHAVAIMDEQGKRGDRDADVAALAGEVEHAGAINPPASPPHLAPAA